MTSVEGRKIEPGGRLAGYPLLGLVALGASAFWLTFWYWFCHPGLNHIDAYAHLPWTYRWRDAALFPNDVMTDYFQRYHLTPGLRAAYYGLVALAGLNLTAASYTVAGACFVATFVLLAAAVRQGDPGGRWGNAVAGLATSLLLIAWPRASGVSPFFWLDGGTARAPAAAVLLLLVYAVARPSVIAFNVALVFGALTYPPALVLGFTAAVIAGLTRGSPREILAYFLRLAPGTATAAGIVLLWYPLGVDARFGPLIAWSDIPDAPEIVRHHFPFGPEFVTGTLIPWLKWNVPALAALAVLAGLSGFDRFWSANATLIAAGLAATVASYVLWPMLYDVDRYIVWPQRVVFVTTLGAIVARLIHRVDGGSKLATGIVTLSVVGMIAAGAYRVVRSPVPIEMPPAVADFIAGLPIDVRVAAYPGDGDDVPYRTKRSLLVHPVALYPYHSEFHRKAKARFEATRDAVYATDWAAVRRLRDAFGVQYLIVNRARFRPDRYEPKLRDHVCLLDMADYTRELGDRGPDQPFVLRTPPAAAIAIESGDFMVIDLSRIP